MPTTKTKTTAKKAAKSAGKAGAAKKAAKGAAATKSKKAAGAQSFRVRLETYMGTEATGIVLPFDAQEVFGTRARVPVRGTINGYAFRGSLFPSGDGKHYMVVRKQLREAAGVRGGEMVSFRLERDEEPRVVTPPEDFARALKADKAAHELWGKLSYTHQREYAEHIEEAKRPETRQRRIGKSVKMIAAGKKEPR